MLKQQSSGKSKGLSKEEKKAANFKISRQAKGKGRWITIPLHRRRSHVNQ